MNKRGKLAQSKRWVVKIGSSLLTNDGRGLDEAAIAGWVDQLAALHKEGVELVLVSSGAVAAGMSRLGLKERPRELFQLQATAAVGQMGLVQVWESSFSRHGLHTAQVLLTHDDLSNRTRYLNARSTLRGLVEWGVVPVINENDTVVTSEICFGDNDTLGALVANLIVADVLVILTDQQGLFTKDPRKHVDAEFVSEASAGDASLEVMAGGGAGLLGRGGMLTKVRAAKVAARSGAATIIVSGRESDVLRRLHQGEVLGTMLTSEQSPQAARKQWLAGHLKAKGKLVLDAGAVRAVRESGVSLLSVGVTAVEGEFSRGEMVLCVDAAGEVIARGLVGYSAEEARLILGHSSREIAEVLGYSAEPELVHRDNLVLS
ncbi:glutamate 5-kinase [Pokkaliibacter sp. MBI-7]|uniref:glutamate 5-kinase n=1 Tax=Pokkaliibacter sp. MBI-7 TaxID=3040600 RepID=UPI00244D25CC|nr:glutamate 5-kinase [Pokkaliibacter sp. MBI-7]MDH2434129.1 glutamate 5-kinase [Pokkaliibacter sp. MBI-7]